MPQEFVMVEMPPGKMENSDENSQSAKSAKELGVPSVDQETRTSVSRWLKGRTSDEKPPEEKASKSPVRKFSYVFDSKGKEERNKSASSSTPFSGKASSKIAIFQEIINTHEKNSNTAIARPSGARNGPKPTFSKTMRSSFASRDEIQPSPPAVVVTSNIQPKDDLQNTNLLVSETSSKSKPRTAKVRYREGESSDILLASNGSSAVSLQQSSDDICESPPQGKRDTLVDLKFPITVLIMTSEAKEITVSVSKATTVGELLDSLLQMGLAATNGEYCDDEDVEWGISFDENSNKATRNFLLLSDRPFSPLDTKRIYTFRKVDEGRTKRQNKLGSILGISDENILQSIREKAAKETKDHKDNKTNIGLTADSNGKSGQEPVNELRLRFSKSADGIPEIRSEDENCRGSSPTMSSFSSSDILTERDESLKSDDTGKESTSGLSAPTFVPLLKPPGDNEFKKGRPLVISKSSKALSLLGVVRASELANDEVGSGAGRYQPSGSHRCPAVSKSATFDSRPTQTTSGSASPNPLREGESHNSSLRFPRQLSDVSLDGSAMDLNMHNSTNKNESYKRAGKLADFFGVHHQKEVEQIRKTLKLEYNDASPIRRRIAYLQDTAGQSMLRVYFGNETYKSLAVTTKTTAIEVVSMLLNKIRVKENAELYGLFQSSADGINRQLDPDEKPFEVMRLWEGNEVFLFKKLATNTDEKRKLLTGKRAAKLAGFFGVTQEANQREPPPEFTELLEVLTDGGNDSGLVREIANSNQRTVKINSAGDVSKEGWLILIKDPAASESGETCWCEINNCCLLLQPNQSKDTSVAPNADAEYRFALDQCVIENPKPSTKVSGSYTFKVVSTRTNEENIFGASTLTEAEGWVNALQTAVRKAKNTMSIADFKFHRVLGRGQFGKVLLCSQRSTGNVYAIKVLSKVMMAKEEGVSVGDNVILEGIKHPFIVTLHCACETEDRLYLVLEYVNGGEIFFHVSNFGRFSEERVRFYAAEIFLAMQYLHKNGIIYRDLKLENLMISKEGHIKIADFGLSVRIGLDQPSNETGIVGTTEYLAPEILSGKPHHFSGDWWAYGLVTFEMLCGYHPFYTEDRADLYDNIMQSPVEYPYDISPSACNFLKGMLCRNPKHRLGCVQSRKNRGPGSQPIGSSSGDDPSDAIRQHEFFKSIDFEKLYHKKIEPPFVPEILDDFDTRYFDECFLSEQPQAGQIGQAEGGMDASNWSIFQNR